MTKTTATPAASYSSNVSTWVGIVGSVVTIVLTIWNVHTKSKIDEREASLAALEMQLKARSTSIDESKERVDRYKWVLSLFPTLNSRDAKERSFALNLARLALTEMEAEQLFASLQSSPDTALRKIGQNGLKSIQSGTILLLVEQMNAANADVRKNAVARLSREYASSMEAIEMTFKMYDAENLENLSPSGVINGLYFLSNTDVEAWDQVHVNTARSIIAMLESRNVGNQTKTAINALKGKLKKVEGQR